MQMRLVKTKVPTPEAQGVKGKQVALRKKNYWLLHAKGTRKHCQKNFTYKKNLKQHNSLIFLIIQKNKTCKKLNLSKIREKKIKLDPPRKKCLGYKLLEAFRDRIRQGRNEIINYKSTN